MTTDSAIVFENADMDSNAIAYLNAGQVVRASKKIYGTDPRFYKVSLPNGKFGYVATIDVAASEGTKAAQKAKPRKYDIQRDARLERARVKRELGKPMMFNRWFGLLAGQMKFQEKVPGVHAKDDLLIYGFKVTGPDVLLQGPLMDLNFTLHLGAPSYYDALSRVRPSGFVFMTDTLLLLPFGMGHDSGVYLGLGPWLKYSNFKYVDRTSGALVTPSHFKLGGSFAIGGAYRMGAFSVRLEGKYIAESVTHTAIQLGLQTLY
ncbi:MAG: SH3 domain-containing protein [Bdellovibrionaceae bacterium]|nr:SH3 domain-containing protein [Pseudobdellovibrionaceae bacterium]